MIKNILILILVFYFLVLLQTSFFIYFNILGIVPNFILIAIILINFFEKSERNLGLISALIGGFFLDIFAQNFMGINLFGLYILISLGIAFFVKFALRKYIQIPRF